MGGGGALLEVVGWREGECPALGAAVLNRRKCGVGLGVSVLVGTSQTVFGKRSLLYQANLQWVPSGLLACACCVRFFWGNENKELFASNRPKK